MANIGKILTRVLKLGAITLAPATVVTIGAVKGLPELLSSAKCDVGDIFETGNDKEAKVYNTKLAGREVRKENGVSGWSNFWYQVKNLFVAQDIISQLEKKYNLSENTDVETYKECAREYFREMIGDTKGKSPEEIHELYEKAKEVFILQITHQPKDNIERFNEIMTAVIAELEAGSRGDMAEATLKMSGSRADEISKANALLDNAEENLMNPDALGNVPDVNVATQYHSAYYQNLDETGVDRAIAMANGNLDALDIAECKRLQELRNSGIVLTEDQQRMLTRYENLCLASYAGVMTGLPANYNLGTEFVCNRMRGVNETLVEKDIQKAVFETVANYETSHPELAASVQNLHHTTLARIIDEATDGEYSGFCARYKAEPTAVMASQPISTSANNSTNTASVSDNAFNELIINNEVSYLSNVEVSTLSENQNAEAAKISGENNLKAATVSGYAAPSQTEGHNISEKNGSSEGHKHVAQNASANAQPAKDQTKRTNTTVRPTVITSYNECKEFISNSSEAAKDIITGKVRLSSASAQNLVINEYKMMHSADQGRILGSATGKWYNKLKNNTRNKSAAIEAFLGSGNKGNSYERTKDMQKTLEEERAKVA